MAAPNPSQRPARRRQAAPERAPRATRRRARDARRGFTLVELVIVVLILGVLAGVALPATLRVFQGAAEQAVVTQVQQIFAAAELYHTRHGEWPANSGRREFPPELTGLLPERVFTEPTPLGSYYDWNGPGTTIPTFGVTIQGLSDEELRSLDQAADNGDPKTGWIRRNGQNVNFVIAER